MWYKKAFDKSFIGDEAKENSQSGVYGTYYNKFSPEDLQKAKNQLGEIGHSPGFKTWNSSSGNKRIAMIEENLALIYFAPIINHHTSLSAPVIKSVSLSSILKNNLVVTQNMPGMKINEGVGSYLDNNKINAVACHQITEALKNVGLRWTDCHSGNYFLHPDVLAHALDIVDPRGGIMDNVAIFEKHNLDMSNGAAIVDLGGMEIYASSPHISPLLNFKSKIETLREGMYKIYILEAINNIIK